MSNSNDFKTAEPLLPFDPVVLLQDVVKRWIAIVLVAVAVGVGSYIYTDMNYQPVYRTTATFVVTTRGSAASVFNNLTSTANLASVFQDILNSSVLRKSILEEIGATHFTGSIQASVVPESNLLTMTVTASEPRMAFQVAQAVINHHEEVTYKIMDDVILEVLQHPAVPTGASNSNSASAQMKKMAIMAGLAACAGFTVLSFFRNAVRSGKEARTKLDCDYLGELPHVKKNRSLMARLRRVKSSILITNPATNFRFVENIRKLRRRVEQHMHGGKILMVTSLLENEGKSTVAVNVALSMAQKHGKVLLIDCDLRKPACYAVLEKKDFAYGLMDVLGGKAKAEEAVITDKKSNLALLLERHGTDKSVNVISSDEMQTLLKWAAEQYDYVVLDLPPMAEASDSESMTDLVDACLLVVRQNAATAPAINKAIAALENGKAKLLGCVLNNVYSTMLSSGQGYGRGAYGRYSHYGRYGGYGGYDSGNDDE